MNSTLFSGPFQNTTGKSGRFPVKKEENNDSFFSRRPFAVIPALRYSEEMKSRLILFFLLACVTAVPGVGANATELNLRPGNVQVCFTPGEGCTELIANEIGRAKAEILVQAYSFTSAPIARALVQAQRRGIRVEVILDRSQKSQRYTSATFLANSGVPTYIDSEHAIAHNKIMIIDREVVITGSFNFTKAAQERNAENLLVIRNHDFAEIYRGNWVKHRAHSEKP